MTQQTRASELSDVRLRLLPKDRADEPVPALLNAPIIFNQPFATDYWRLRLEAPHLAAHTRPGQFAMLTVAQSREVTPVLPRPMAIYARDEGTGTIDIVYRVVGEGTRRLAGWPPDQTITLVGPLGRGFDLEQSSRAVLIVGRGIGTCSLTMLAKEAVMRGMRVLAVTSGRQSTLVVGVNDYLASGAEPVIAVHDEDGSSAVNVLRSRLRGLLADVPVEQIFTCGSNRLLLLTAELADSVGATAQVSLEAHMACGLGYCHGCSTGHPGLLREAPLVCRDGPVFAYGTLDG